ncbi:DUF4252 domain-containing protein [Mesoflavibacter sp. CH_XMU1422-2]|uniref:DUF4252 domain-containing protein n=1 Tax=Mesoflavibacter sp. CH_XMU1422-2 TaxID=3107770 RepID=UPI00300A7081
MKNQLKSIITVLTIALLFVSCKDENSIQTYFVDHREQPEFLSLDLSAKMLDLSKADLTVEQQEAYNSIEKLDVLAYRVNDGDVVAYEQELQKAKKVFKNEKYEELMEFKDNGISFKISTIGNENTVDEFLVLANSKEMGFTFVRVIGDEMKPEQLVKLITELQHADVDNNQLNQLFNYFK